MVLVTDLPPESPIPSLPTTIPPYLFPTMSAPAVIQNNINHVVLILDASSSMSGFASDVVRVFDNQIAHLATRSKEMDQETRVSVYTFADAVQCLIYDRDVLRLPSLASHYHAHGNTALIDGVLKSIEDLRKTPEMYGNHAFIAFCLTDGEENRSSRRPADLSSTLKSLPDNWTVAALVPNAMGSHECKKAGFSADNISIWNTSSARGVEEAGDVIRAATDTFMRARATGVRGTKSLFTMDATALSSAAIKGNLKELSPTQYMVLPVSRKVAIKDFVESWTKEPYLVGSAYHTLVKPEKVQAGKQVCIQHKLTGKVYAGAAARELLGLPDHEVKVEPAAHPDYAILLQSQSVNRLLVPGTNLLVMK